MKKLLSSLLVLAMVASLMLCISGCGQKETLTADQLADFTETLTAEKIGSIKLEQFQACEGGLIYKKETATTGERYGVMSLNGTKDTGALYAYATYRDNMFEVTSTMPTGYADISGLNSFQLISGEGKSLALGYAKYHILNDRFIVCMRVTAETLNKEEAVVTYHASYFPFSTTEKYFAGEWLVKDLETGNYIPGVGGKKEPGIFATGSYVTYKDETTGEYVTVDAQGKVLPQHAKEFDDGTYAIEEKIGSVYNAKGEKLFDYDLTGYIPYQPAGKYYIAKMSTDTGTKYAIMDRTGKVVSTEFTSDIDLYGNLVYADQIVYNFQGEKVVEGLYAGVYYDELFGSCYLLREEDDCYTMIKEDGSIVFQDYDDDETTIFTDEFVAQTEKEDESGPNSYYWSHKDKDYTIKGYSFAPYIVKVSATNGLYNIVNTINGENLLEGYNDYSYSEAGKTALYVYAKYNGGTDIFLIVNPTQLTQVQEKKGRLIDGLAAAFKQEGINVTVNQETGEMAMDSSVLFGGDSSVLTAAGKQFLNKFLRAYTKVAFSGEYEGFISKTLVEGHTAPVSGSTYASGLPLSEERAKVVKDYCLSKETGIQVAAIAGEFEDVGYSNSQPVYDASGNVDMAASRRVSFRFMVNITVE